MSNKNTAIFHAEMPYYQNKYGNKPQTIRVKAMHGEEIIGTCFGREYTVKASDYEPASKQGKFL